MNRADASTIVDAIRESPPVRLVLATATMACVVAFLGVMALAVAIDCANGRADESPS